MNSNARNTPLPLHLQTIEGYLQIYKLGTFFLFYTWKLRFLLLFSNISISSGQQMSFLVLFDYQIKLNMYRAIFFKHAKKLCQDYTQKGLDAI